MNNDVAVVIGAGGIGLAIARRVSIGRALLLADYNEKVLNEAAEQLRTEGHEVVTQTVDVSDPVAVAELADEAAALGSVTRLAQSAGLSPVMAPPEQILKVDLYGTALVLEEFARVIAPGGAGVVIASMAGHMVDPFPAEIEHALAFTPAADLLALPFLGPDTVTDSGIAYGVSKRANALRVRGAALAWGERGARLNCMSPGIVATPLALAEMTGPGAEGYRMMIETSAAGRMASPTELAETAAFLLGEQAGFITGSDLLIDGGVIAARYGAQLPPLFSFPR